MTPEELSHARHMIEHTSYTGPITGSKLLAHIDDQAAQIETLKSLLIEAQVIIDFSGGQDFTKSLWEEWKAVPARQEDCKEMIDDARIRLEAKYPEAMK